MIKAPYYRPITTILPLRLTPGPFEVAPTVAEASARAFFGHRSPPFRRILGEVREMLLEAYEIENKKAYAATLLTGTGTAAMEMMVCSTVSVHRPLVVVNGRFGRRLADMCLIHNPATQVVEFEPGSAIELDLVESAMKSNKTNQLLFCVQDTRDAVLNPFDELCRLAKRHDHLLAVDAISSAIFESLNFDGCGVDLFVDSSGKGVRSLPGVSFVMARRDVLAGLRRRDAGSYYLDLLAEFEIQDSRSEPRFAPAVPLYAALHQALVELMEESVKARRECVHRRTRLVRRRINASTAFSPLHDWSRMPNSITSALVNSAKRYEDISNPLQERGILVYSGSSVRNNCIQIGTGGYLSDDVLDEAMSMIVEIAESIAVRPGGQDVYAA